MLDDAKREVIASLLAQAHKFQLCGPSDDSDEQTAVTVGYRHLVIQLQRLLGPVLPKALASRLNAFDVEVNNIYSAYEVHAELDVLLPDISRSDGQC